MNRARWGGEEKLWRREDHTMATQAFGDEEEGGSRFRACSVTAWSEASQARGACTAHCVRWNSPKGKQWKRMLCGDWQFGFGRRSKQRDEVTEMARKKTFDEGWGWKEKKRINEQQEGFVCRTMLSHPSVEWDGEEALWRQEDSAHERVAKGGTNASLTNMLQQSSEWSACR
jgi:hypothetical protein